MSRRNPYVKPDKMVLKIMRAAFPDFSGQQVEIVPHAGTINLASYWSGGSIERYAFVRLDNLRAQRVPEQSEFSPQIPGLSEFKMVPGVVVVSHNTFQGKRTTPRIYVHPDNMNQLALPAPSVELDMIQALALLATRMYISSARYEAFRNWTNATKAQYDAIRGQLQAKGMLKANNSLTIDGRNVAAKWRDEYAVCETYGVEPVAYFKKMRGW
jgi:hypothetical protein